MKKILGYICLIPLALIGGVALIFILYFIGLLIWDIYIHETEILFMGMTLVGSIVLYFIGMKLIEEKIK